MSELPQIEGYAYATTTSALDNISWGGSVSTPDVARRIDPHKLFQNNLQDLQKLVESETKENMPTTQRRIVQVLIVDPDENVPLTESVLHQGGQKLTDATDQELFFEVPIADLLAKHNEKRIKWLDKCASKKAGKDIFLEAARIRDLKMLVVTIASF